MTAGTASVLIVVRIPTCIAHGAQVFLKFQPLLLLLFALRLGCSSGADVDVDAPRMIGHLAKVGALGIKVLNQVIKSVPFPDDFRALWPSGFEFQNTIHPQALRTHALGITPPMDRISPGLSAPDDRKNVAIGQGFDVVVQALLIRAQLVLPKEFAVPVEFHNAAPFATPSHGSLGLKLLATEEVAVIQEINRVARRVLALPGVHRSTFVIDQPSTPRLQGCEECEP